MISVVILTRNRLAQLQRCLESLSQQSFSEFEVVVVVHQTTDHTLSFLQSLTHTSSLLSTLTLRWTETQKGSFAELRNLGCSLARGDIIAFIDDDCQADPRWLEYLHESLTQHDAVGGPVLLLNPLEFPSWWDAELNWLIGLSPPSLLNPSRAGVVYPQTANMAFRRQLWLQFPFQSMGSAPPKKAWLYVRGREDTLFWKQLRLSRARTTIESRAVVYHQIPAERLRWRNLWRRALSDGWAFYFREQQLQYLSKALYDLLSAPLPLLRLTIKSLFRRGRRRRHYRSLMAQRLLWLIRQVGFVAAVLRHRRVHALPRVLFKTAGAASAVARDYGKSTAREISFPVLRRLHPRTRLHFPLERLLCISLGFLGDQLVIQPSLRLLRQQLPEVPLHFLCFENGKQLYEDEGIFEKIWVCPRSPDAAQEFIRSLLSRNRFSAAIIYYYHFLSPLPVLLHKKLPTIGFSSDNGFRRQLWHKLLDYRQPRNYARNEILNTLSLLQPLRLNTNTLPPYSLARNEAAEHSLRDKLPEVPEFIAINMGAGYRSKEWATQHWLTLTSKLKSQNIPVVFIGEKWWRWEADYILSRTSFPDSDNHRNRANLCGRLALKELVELIRLSKLLITTDSGPKHLAFALGTPTITLYGPTEEWRWGALWNEHQHPAVRASNLFLSPEELINCPENHQMLLISPEQVFQKLTDLSETPPK